MGWLSQFLPTEASTMAARVDALFLFLLGMAIFFSLLIAGLVLGFALRFRRRSEQRPGPTHVSFALEVVWTLIPLAIVTAVFFWSSRLFFAMNRPPRDAVQVNVVGKRWMWKLQHMTGQREINELHVPVGVPVK